MEGEEKGDRDSVRYESLKIELPRDLRARLQATATVVQRDVAEVVSEALDLYLDRHADGRHELLDRIASSLLHATEIDGSDS